MSAKNFALTAGIVYVVLGVMGFFPAFRADAPMRFADIAVETNYGLLFGLFAVNILLNLVRVGMGVWGIYASRNRLEDAQAFSRATAITFAVLTIFGFIPVLNVLFGLMPLYGHNIWLHAITAIAAGYFGYYNLEARGRHSKAVHG